MESAGRIWKEKGALLFFLAATWGQCLGVGISRDALPNQVPIWHGPLNPTALAWCSSACGPLDMDIMCSRPSAAPYPLHFHVSSDSCTPTYVSEGCFLLTQQPQTRSDQANWNISLPSGVQYPCFSKWVLNSRLGRDPIPSLSSTLSSPESHIEGFF